MRTLILLASFLASVAFGPATAQSLHRFGAPERHVEAELVAATDAIVAGRPLTVGLRLKHQHEWHTYWQVPGDSGLPTQINWKLPAGFTAGPIEWPHPRRLPVGPLMNFGYEGETLLLTTIQVPADVKAGSPVTLNAKAEWLECREVCIPGDAEVALTLPVKADAGPSKHAALFRSAQASVPQQARDVGTKGAIEANRIRVDFSLPTGRKFDQIEFYPLEEGRIEPAAAQVLKREGSDRASLYLTAAKPVAADFRTLKGVVVANGGPANASGWTGIVEVPLTAGAVAASVVAAAAVAVAERRCHCSRHSVPRCSAG
jgi:thiol:disulfide interchange protein DsbD